MVAGTQPDLGFVIILTIWALIVFLCIQLLLPWEQNLIHPLHRNSPKSQPCIYVYTWENIRGSFYSILLVFFKSYVEHDLRKNKIVVALLPFFCQ